MPTVPDHLWALEDTQVHCSATIVPYAPARGPTYSCAGEPPEGGYAEDLRVWFQHPTNPDIPPLDITDWLTEKEQETILEDIYATWDADRKDAVAYAEDLAIEQWLESHFREG